jgi:biopolymer transport protein ExbD
MRRKKHLDFELNLIPYIDLLSTCICFLLLTAVWLQVGAVSVKQAVGGQPASETAKKPTMWVQMQSNGDVALDVRDARIPARLARMKVAGVDGKPDVEKLGEAVDAIRQVEPNLATALIQPQAASIYEHMIDIMDRFRRAGLNDIGVSPL